jgi:hypothetical protein
MVKANVSRRQLTGFRKKDGFQGQTGYHSWEDHESNFPITFKSEIYFTSGLILSRK